MGRIKAGAECGAKKPENGWACGCGSVNQGKFCPERGGRFNEDDIR